MHAEEGKVCGEIGCEFFDREPEAVKQATASVKVVKRETKSAKAVKEAKTEPQRKTKKSTLKKPRKWGGRSGS